MKRLALLLGSAVLVIVATAVITNRIVGPRPPYSWPPQSGVAAEHLASPPPTDPMTVSLVRLIADPDTYDGKPIRTVGFAHLEFEGDALYLHREDFEHVMPPNSVGLRVPAGPAFAPFSDRYVIVEGIFEVPRKGYLNLRGGSIRDISRFDPLPTRQGLMSLLGSKR